MALNQHEYRRRQDNRGPKLALPCQPLHNKEPTPSDKDQQETDAFVKKFHEAYDNNDAAALAAFYTQDATIVTPQGPIYGREAIEKWYADGFQKMHHKNHIDKVDQGSPHRIGTAGNEAWSNGEWSETIQGKDWGPIQLKGYWSNNACYSL